MKAIKFLLAGIFFGIVMFKSEAASWYRIFEMFQFDAFHMYGVMGSALVVGVIGIQIIKQFRVKTFDNEPIELCEKQKGYKRYLFGGTLFGLGWALSGACPGPMFTLLGAGYLPIAIVIISAIAGTFVYGLVMKYLPHY